MVSLAIFLMKNIYILIKKKKHPLKELKTEKIEKLEKIGDNNIARTQLQKIKNLAIAEIIESLKRGETLTHLVESN